MAAPVGQRSISTFTEKWGTENSLLEYQTKGLKGATYHVIDFSFFWPKTVNPTQLSVKRIKIKSHIYSSLDLKRQE